MHVILSKVRNTVPYRCFDLGSISIRYGIPSDTPRCVEYLALLQCYSAFGPVTGGPRTNNLSDRYVPPVPDGTV